MTNNNNNNNFMKKKHKKTKKKKTTTNKQRFPCFSTYRKSTTLPLSAHPFYPGGATYFGRVLSGSSNTNAGDYLTLNNKPARKMPPKFDPTAVMVGKLRLRMFSAMES